MSEFFTAIETACEGLIYISETDAPVLPFAGSAATEVTGEVILQQTEAKADEPIEEVSITEFFGRLTAVKDWFGEAERARAIKFLDLHKLIEENLCNGKVFRIGAIRVQIFVVGINAEGRLMGVSTEAVET